MKRCLVVSLGRCHPSSRIRLQAFGEELARRGWGLDFHHLHPGMGRGPACSRWQRLRERVFCAWQELWIGLKLRWLGPEVPVIVSREVPMSPRLFERMPNPMVLDIDDALYLGPGRETVLRLCRRAEVVVCGNSILQAALGPHSQATRVIPTVVDCERFVPEADRWGGEELRLGWLGSSMSLDYTLQPFLPVLQRLQQKLRFRLVVVVDGCPEYLRQHAWIEHVEWNPRLETRLGRLFEVGLMPLQADDFQAAKCGCKLIQYMACGLPSVASDVGVNADLVRDVGWVAGNEEQWHDALIRLAEDDRLRAEMGARARQRAVEHYSIAVWAPSWAELLEDLSTRRTSR